MKRIIMVVMVVMLVGVAGCGSKENRKSNKMIQLKGSDTILSLGQKVSERLMGEDKSIRIAVTGGGSGTGIAALLNGNVDIAQASRKIKDKEVKMASEKGINVVEHIIAFDGITVIVNKSNQIDNLTQEQIRAIFIGEINNWKEIGGVDKKIVVLSRDNSSGTHVFFKEHVLRSGKSKGPEEYRDDSVFLPSNQALVGEVENSEGAIAYIGMGYMTPKVKALSVNGVKATVKNVSENKYPVSRALYWYTGGSSGGSIKTMIDYMMSEKGQAIVLEEGFVPVK